MLVFLLIGLVGLHHWISRPPVSGTGREYVEYFGGIVTGAVFVLFGLVGLGISLALDFPQSLKTARGVSSLAMAVLGILMVAAPFVRGYDGVTMTACSIGGVLMMVGLLGLLIRFRPDRKRREP